MNSSRSTTVVVLIPFVSADPWARFKFVQERTWVSDAGPGQVVVYYSADRHPNALRARLDDYREKLRFHRLALLQRGIDRMTLARAYAQLPGHEWNGRDLTVESFRGLSLLGIQTVTALQAVLERYDPHLIVRCNTSTYLNWRALTKVAEDYQPNDILYGGEIEKGVDFWGFDFVNGASIVLSRVAAQLVVENFRKLDPGFLDDVSIGKLMDDAGVVAVPLFRPTIRDDSDLDTYSDHELHDAYAIRIRTSTNPRTDDQMLQRLHQRVRRGL